MKFILFKLEKVDSEQFVSFWSERYNQGKYSDDEYFRNLNLEGLLSEDNIRYLWEWKNAGPLSPKKKPVIEKTINKLTEINKFRKLSRINNNDIDLFYKLTSEIVGTGLIWRIFLFHIARPDEFPIFDQHVFRAFNFINESAVDISAVPESMEDYNNYRDFFWNFVKESNKHWREADKALMAFGQFLKSQFYKGDALIEESK